MRFKITDNIRVPADSLLSNKPNIIPLFSVYLNSKYPFSMVISEVCCSLSFINRLVCKSALQPVHKTKNNNINLIYCLITFCILNVLDNVGFRSVQPNLLTY